MKYLSGTLLVALVAAVVMLTKVGDSYLGDVMPLFIVCMVGSLMLLGQRR